ncbi:hypothetical protein SAMN05216251_11599 [Actinacidiphila alni]|uniref:Uncharacterized protein n=1 Tax=Actinacidiphila alni TaxID=380248 RepID=A0A1I2IYG2_9ACTN|nr:hypothetical protein [Actinacidiphila alni]SFF47209.1 hypothetical protein SAMN05216251_11599 [Actinacidiphila alni]
MRKIAIAVCVSLSAFGIAAAAFVNAPSATAGSGGATEAGPCVNPFTCWDW